MKKKLLYLFMLMPGFVFSQTGRYSFQFLNVSSNARLAALGGVNVSLYNEDVNFFYANPALVGDTLKQWAAVNYQFYAGDIGHAAFTYAHPFKKAGMFTFGVQHVSYGTIKGYDDTGMHTGDFKSGETALYISRSHQVNHFRFGVNIKAAFSNIAGYRASALLADLGGTFIHPKQNLTIGLVMKNMGIVLSEYTETSSSRLPFDLQLGTTFKPQHMPLRFSLTVYNLAQKGDAEADGETLGTFDKVIRHFNFGTEVLVSKNVLLMTGYNCQVHQELKLSSGGGGAGISVGFVAKIKRATFSFSRSGFVAGSAGYSFTVSGNTSTFLMRRQ